MEHWLRNRLSKCLNFKVPDDMISYILTLETVDEIDQHFKTLLNYNVRGHRYFVYEFKQRKFNNFKNQKETLVKISNENNKKYENQNENEGIKNKIPKLENLHIQDDKITSTFDISGRHRCDCQANKHKLINNCRKCGRIICEKEGSGPCLFCGNFVSSIEEPKFIIDSSQQLDNLKSNLYEQNQPKCSAESMKPNNFLEYDESIEKPTAPLQLTDESVNFKTNLVRFSDCEKKKHDNLKENLYEQNQPKCSGKLVKQNGLQYVGAIEKRQAAPQQSDESIDLKTNFVRSSDPEKKKGKLLEEKGHEVLEEPKHEGEEEIRINKNANRLLKKITIDFSGKEIYEGPIITIEYKT